MKEKQTLQDSFLEACYTSLLGRILLKPFVCKPFSMAMGWLLDCKLSTAIIPWYQKTMKIDLTDVADQSYESFNDFFTRKLKDGARPFCNEQYELPSPCDGRAMAFSIDENSRLNVKHTSYSVEQLLCSSKLAKRYEGGTAVLIRLTVSDYHRYCYPVSGKKSINRRIEGKYHTVNPIANEVYPIYKMNTREYTQIQSPIYGSVIQMEVGALCVGRIVNYLEKGIVKCGEEKGRFEFGGSSILLFFEKDAIDIREDLLAATQRGEETPVRMGEALGTPSIFERM